MNREPVCGALWLEDRNTRAHDAIAGGRPGSTASAFAASHAGVRLRQAAASRAGGHRAASQRRPTQHRRSPCNPQFPLCRTRGCSMTARTPLDRQRTLIPFSRHPANTPEVGVSGSTRLSARGTHQNPVDGQVLNGEHICQAVVLVRGQPRYNRCEQSLRQCTAQRKARRAASPFAKNAALLTPMDSCAWGGA